LSEELERFLKGTSTNRVDALTERKALEASLVTEIQRLMVVILRPESDGSEALPQMLRVKEAQLKQVRSDIALLSVPRTASNDQA